jgi:subtilisin-like proprotein convertase family protein
VIGSVDVGLRIDHPRVSDLAVTLISPRGTRVLLVENRGGTDPNGFGSSLTVTNFVPVAATGGAAGQTNYIDTGAFAGDITIDYTFFELPDQMTVYYNDALLADTGMASGSGRLNLPYGPGPTTVIEIRMNEFGNLDTNTAWNYTISSISQTHSYLTFTEKTNLTTTTTPIKFAAPPFVGTTGASTFISGFEPPLTPGNYVPPATPDGWTLLNTNPVVVVTNPVYAGDQALILRGGHISRVLNTVPGRTYRLGYAYRREAQCFAYPDFSSTAGLALGGTAASVTNVLRLNPAVESSIGSAWYGDKQNAAGGFETTFTFAISDIGSRPGIPPGADGIAFSVQNQGWGAGFGPAAISDTVTVFYNTFLNWPGCTDFTVCDVSDNSVGVMINQTYLAQTDLTPLGINLSDGLPHSSLISYTNGSFSVWLDGTLVLTNVPVPNLTPGRDIAGRGWAGFSSHSGWAWENHDILNWSFCATETLSGATITVPGLVTNTFLGTESWQLGGVVFTATNTNTVVHISPAASNGVSGLVFDEFTLVEAGSQRYVLPEESLKVLEGENTFGLWQLEVWDNRTGASNNVTLVDWQLSFIFQTNTAPPRALTPGVPVVISNLPPGQIVYFSVDAPTFARFATNILFNANVPVGFYFNQIRPPSLGATNVTGGDIGFAANALNHTEVLSAPSIVPPTSALTSFVPGQRYFLAVENTSAANASFTVLVDFDLATFPPATDLTNGVPFCTINPFPLSLDHYRFTVSSNAVRAQFELRHLTGDMTLLLRRDLPPTLSVFDYLSANVHTNDEVITVFDFSQPVPLTPGTWYFAAANLSTGPVGYCAAAREWTEYGTNIVITNVFLGTNSFCLEWTSLEGVPYVVEGLTNLTSTNWVSVSPTVYGTGDTTTYCVPLPSPYQFFRVREGMELDPFVPQPVITRIVQRFNGIEITWSGPPGQQYQVEWSPTLIPTAWTSFTEIVTSVTGVYQYLDDGSQTGGFGPVRYYRLVLLP